MQSQSQVRARARPLARLQSRALAALACPLALLCALAWTSPVGWAQESPVGPGVDTTRTGVLEVTALANSGVLLRAGGRAVLIDAFVAEPHSLYDALPADVLALLRSALPPFDTVAIALSTHAHRDHLQAAPARAFLARSPRTRLVGPPQARALVLGAPTDDSSTGSDPPREPGGADDAELSSIAARVVAMLPAVGGTERLEHDDVAVEVLRLSHGTGRFADVESLGFLVTLGGFRVLHLGDADMDPAALAGFDLPARRIDVAVLPYWFWMSATGRRLIDERVAAAQLVACHVPAAEWEDVEAYLRDRHPEVRLAPAPLTTWRYDGRGGARVVPLHGDPRSGASGADATTRRVDADGVGLALVLRTEPDLRLDVETWFAGDDDGDTLLGVSETWAGVPADRIDLRGLTVSTTEGSRLVPVPVGRHRWRVAHPPGAGLVVRAHLSANRLRGDLGSQDRYRPMLEPGLFHAIGHLLLPLPEGRDEDAPLRLSLRLGGFDQAGWRVYGSYGHGSESREATTTLADLRHALFAAGRLAEHRREVSGGTLTVTLDDTEWPFAGDAFADLAARIVNLERRFMGDSRAGDTWIDAIAVGQPDARGLSFGGTALTGAFALFLQPDTEIALDSRGGLPVRKLLAHECFHEWNGRRLRLAEPEEPLYWFSEGFTDHFARAILRAAGWLDEAAYVESLNELLRDYATSPLRNLPADELGERFWSDRAAQQQPYLRGDLVAFVLDHGVRAASAGERGLVDVMRELLAESRVGGGAFDAERLLAAFARHAGADLAAALQRVVVDGETLEVPADLLGPGWRLVQELVSPWDPGFDLEASLAAGRVIGLRAGTPAAEAGLVEGATLVGWSVHRGVREQPVELQVQDEGGVTTIRYLPLGAPVPVPRFLPAD